MKKCLSVLLSAVLCLLLCVPAFAVLGEGYYTTLPTIYLQGQGDWIAAEKGNIKSERLDEFEIPDGYIGDAAKALIPPLLKGLTLNQWQEWEDEFVARVLPLVEKVALDENGEASNGSGPVWHTSTGNRRNNDGVFDMNSYVISYDWRLDPCATADEVQDYIEKIKASTGAEKVNLIGRSIGASVVLAYLAEYGMADIETVILYCPSFYGMEAVSRLFAGKLDVDPKGISRFLDFYVNSGEMGESDAQLYALLKDVVAVMAKSGQLNLTAKLLERIYEKVWRDVYPRLLVKMYGSMPSFWSLVGDDDYAAAKAAVFAGQDLGGGVCHAGFQVGRHLLVSHGGQPRLELPDLLFHAFDVAIRRERQHVIAVKPCHVQRLHADGAGGAEYDQFFVLFFHHVVNQRPAAASGSRNKRPARRS